MRPYVASSTNVESLLKTGLHSVGELEIGFKASKKGEQALVLTGISKGNTMYVGLSQTNTSSFRKRTYNLSNGKWRVVGCSEDGNPTGTPITLSGFFDRAIYETWCYIGNGLEQQYVSILDKPGVTMNSGNYESSGVKPEYWILHELFNKFNNGLLKESISGEGVNYYIYEP